MQSLAFAMVLVASEPQSQIDSTDDERLGLNNGLQSALTHRVELDQPIPILAEYRVMPECILNRRQADEPPEQQVARDLLDQLPLAADAVQQLEQLGCPSASPARCSGGHP